MTTSSPSDKPADPAVGALDFELPFNSAPQPNKDLGPHSSDPEVEAEKNLLRLFRETPIPERDLLRNLGLYIRRQEWARYLFMHELYRLALDKHGVIMEFGTRWGQNLAVFSSFRGIYEPNNYTRRIVAFDTFEGFPSVDSKDGSFVDAIPGALAVAQGWDEQLAALLLCHEQFSSLPHLRKFELIKGDVSDTVPEYFERHPETVVALAYFDLDLYKPTVDALRAIKPHLVRGSVLGFDEVSHDAWPGETLALREEVGLSNISLRRMPFAPTPSYCVWE